MNSRSYQAWGSPFSILQRKPDIPLVGSFHAPARQAHPFSTLLLLVNDSGEGDSSTFPRAEGQVTETGVTKSMQRVMQQILNGAFLGWSKGETEGRDPGLSTKIVSRHP